MNEKKGAVLILVLVLLAWAGVCGYRIAVFSDNDDLREFLSRLRKWFSEKRKLLCERCANSEKSSKQKTEFTPKDRDMVELIHLLSETYRTTDEYLNRK